MHILYIYIYIAVRLTVSHMFRQPPAIIREYTHRHIQSIIKHDDYMYSSNIHCIAVISAAVLVDVKCSETVHASLKYCCRFCKGVWTVRTVLIRNGSFRFVTRCDLLQFYSRILCSAVFTCGHSCGTHCHVYYYRICITFYCILNTLVCIVLIMSGGYRKMWEEYYYFHPSSITKCLLCIYQLLRVRVT